jgi:acetyltransferase-like isoleucine patch superfamily enzyme
MYAYIVATHKTLQPFGEHPRECLVGNVSLQRVQQEALTQAGLDPVRVESVSAIRDDHPHVILEDRLFFTPELIEQFVVQSGAQGKSTRCAMQPGPVTDTTAAATQGVPMTEGAFVYDLRFEPAARLRGAPALVILNPEQDYAPLPVSRHMTPLLEPVVPISDLLLIRVDHWVNLWAANLSVLVAEIARLRKNKLRLLGLALRARSLNKWNVLRANNVIGHNCDIHPTAYIEGSRIGDGTRIGAGAVVRGSLIGTGSRILNRATVELSILGEGVHIMNGCTAQFAVLYPGHLTMSNLVSLSICGRDTFLGDGATLADFRFDGRSVSVLKDGESIDSGITFLGGCLGHGAYLGAGCILAPGRAIANGWRISRESGVIKNGRTGAELEGLRVLAPRVTLSG